MSIAVLNQVYDETRRLAIAGSNLAAGDFRLKKLVPPLEKAGEKAPVFAKVAGAVEGVLESDNKNSAEALLELSTLVTAILYTQGQTGAEGKLQPLEASKMKLPATEASARVLKPLVEALTTTGSGRLEIIRDAHERQAFHDLRLVNPALAAIDDPSSEIADFVADKVLPVFGRTIYPELKSSWDMKGRGGHVRRLKLMYQFDPQATHALAEEALESGSKEMKIAALTCLKNSKEDLPHLLDGAKAKSKDVRAAALESLAAFTDDEAVDALKKALSGPDLNIAARPAAGNRSPKLLKFLLEDGKAQLDALLAARDKAKLKKQLQRFDTFLLALSGRDDKQTLAFLSDCFGQRDALSKLKGDTSGDDVNYTVANMLVSSGNKPLLKQLVDAHETLDERLLDCAFVAAIKTLPPKAVYDRFSPYLLAKPAGRKKRNDPVELKRATIHDRLCERSGYAYRGYYYGDEMMHIIQDSKLDDRWLDTAVKTADLELVTALIRPGHKAANKFLAKQMDALLKKREAGWEISQLLDTMNRAEHPGATDYFLAALSKVGKSTRRYYGFGYWMARLVPDLPKSAAAKIEELLPTLPDHMIDELLPYVQELKAKK